MARTPGIHPFNPTQSGENILLKAVGAAVSGSTIERIVI